MVSCRDCTRHRPPRPRPRPRCALVVRIFLHRYRDAVRDPPSCAGGNAWKKRSLTAHCVTTGMSASGRTVHSPGHCTHSMDYEHKGQFSSYEKGQKPNAAVRLICGGRRWQIRAGKTSAQFAVYCPPTSEECSCNCPCRVTPRLRHQQPWAAADQRMATVASRAPCQGWPWPARASTRPSARPTACSTTACSATQTMSWRQLRVEVAGPSGALPATSGVASLASGPLPTRRL